jgi:ubiquinone/menaquinone biosynthesis C-methylase UbiE
LYDDHVLPHLVNLSMRNRLLLPYRQRVVSQAAGRVLEVGIGSALNLPYYGPEVTELLGLEPAERLMRMAERSAVQSKRSATFIAGSAEAIPLDSASVDMVVMTWTLCSIPDAIGALRQMRRVLRPGGQLLFVEHGRAPDERVVKWQDRLTPFWKAVSGGCHLNRPIATLIESAGFTIADLRTGYMRGPKPMTFMYEGRAQRI